MITSMRAGLLSVLLVGACGSQLDVGLGIVDTESTSSAASTTSGSTSTALETTSGADSSSSAGTSTSTDATTTTDSSSETSGSTGETEGLEESPCLAEQEICAEVELDGAPVGFCGQTLELQGTTASLGPSRWSIEDCDACSSCDGPVYEIEIFGPADWVPAEVPTCSRIAIDFAPLDDSPYACAFTGIAIWANRGSTEDPAPVYVAASITTDAPASLPALQVSRENVDPKECAEAECCAAPPGKYELTFSDAGITEPFVLAEHDEALDVTMLGQSYAARNERSHAHEQCDRIPHFDWIMVRGA
jgi:hypothetical protein